MPILIPKANNLTEIHTAERLEINLVEANEDISKMVFRCYFNVEVQLNGESITKPLWDSENPLVFQCDENDTELYSAIQVVQARIGAKRYQQLHEGSIKIRK